MKIDQNLDLVINRVLDITPEQAFKGWTSPELFSEWFCPKPWKVSEARLDLKPGGEFYTVMQSPDGASFPSHGCVLEVVTNKKFVWTNSLTAGYRPANNEDMPLTVTLLFEAEGNKTKYTAIAQHGSAEVKKKHQEMGFEEGWSICADQLVKLVKEKL